MEETTLYKLDARNNLLFWTITPHNRSFEISWGYVGDQPRGKEVYATTNVKEEAARRIAKQVERRGYTPQKPKRPPDLPMLAQVWDEDRTKLWDSLFIQPKLDGIRCIGSNKGLTSRRNLPIKSCPHIYNILAHLPDGVKLDGELYIPNTDRATIQGLVIRDHPHRLHTQLQYHVFDIIDTETPFNGRIAQVRHAIGKLQEEHAAQAQVYNEIPRNMKDPSKFPSSCPILIVPTHQHSHPQNKKATIKRYFQEFRKAGFEGAILRNGESYYELNTRSYDLLKYKERMDAEFKIVDINMGFKETGIFVCETTEGVVFEATPAWTLERKRWLWKQRESFIGKMLTVEFEGFSKDGTPLQATGRTTRHPDT